jgi:bifunctional oligoribonuclease and PAP phosphatase NrnA
LNQINFPELAAFLSKPRNIVVTSHYNPDGDAVGSVLALYHVLQRNNHRVQVILPNRFPAFLSWIEGGENILYFENQQQPAQQVLDKAEIIFCLDYNAPVRLENMEQALRNATAMKVLIDHHPNPEVAAFDLSYHSVAASSTAELVYEFLLQAGYDEFINRAAAESIYTGIITDTGSLSFNCNKPETYIIISKLIEKGVDAELLHRLIYDNFSANRMKLLGYALYKKMEVLPESHTAIIPLTINELEQFGFQQGDTEGIVNYPLSIKGINLSVLLTQKKNRIRLSFRSKGVFPANDIAREYFEGGGHRNAAGGDSFVSMDETIKKIKEILPLYQKQLDFEIE